MRPWLSIFLTSIICGTRVSAQHAITVTINNVRNSNGVCNIALYNKSLGFLDPARAVAGKIVKASKGSVKARFDNVPAGTYAIAVIHDENNDKKLNTNFLGIPKEGYGASNNNLPMTSAPKFTASSFNVLRGDQAVDINLKYY
jgi:uncharacterized protein (DUF2141 family)